MGLLAKRRTAEEFGASFRPAYVELYDHMLSKFWQRAEHTISMEMTLTDEVAALVYFAFDFAMSGGDPTPLRNRIRDGFRTTIPQIEGYGQLIADRCDEYARSMRATDREQGFLALGNVFAHHTGSDANIFRVMEAVACFRSCYAMVAEQVHKTIRSIR